MKRAYPRICMSLAAHGRTPGITEHIVSLRINYCIQ